MGGGLSIHTCNTYVRVFKVYTLYVLQSLDDLGRYFK